MKKLKIYFGLTLITLFTSIIFSACSHENSIEETKKTENSQLARGILTTCCGFGGDLVSSMNCNSSANQTATLIYTYGSTQFSYINTTGQVGSAVWALVANPVGSATFSNGLTSISSTGNVTFNYTSNFISATVTATFKRPSNVTSGPLDCASQLNIIKSSNPIVNCDCEPILTNTFYDVPVGSDPSYPNNVINSIQFESSCNFEWKDVSKVKFQIGTDAGSNSLSVPNLNFTNTGNDNNWCNNANWTSASSGFRNIKIYTHKNATNIAPPYLKSRFSWGMQCFRATISFNNGCPDKLIWINGEPCEGIYGF
jgi:hypothetical protein